MGASVRGAQPPDVHKMIALLRDEDVEEMWALNRLDGETTVWRACAASEAIWVFEVDEEFVCLAGIVETGNEEAILWFLFSKEVVSLPMSFFRLAHKFIDKLMTRYSRIYNYGSSENTFVRKFGTLVGFKISGPYVMGNTPTEMLLFEKRGG
jgi:hypothetical protein